MSEPDFANLMNMEFINSLYESYLTDPKSVEPSWRHFFEGIKFASTIQELSKSSPVSISPEANDYRSFVLINLYRSFGHLAADVSPLRERLEVGRVSQLDLKTVGLCDEDLSRMFPTFGLLKEEQAPLSKILDTLKALYCGRVGVECFHCDPELKKSVFEALEQGKTQSRSTERVKILELLNKAEAFEAFINLKFQGQKRFSLEGAETFIPMLHALFETAAELGVKESVLCMAHRGRLNTLVNVFSKPFSDVFCEFEPSYVPDISEGSGDVKYHKGFEHTFPVDGTEGVHLTLVPNASHLESANSIVEGMVKAKQKKFDDSREERVLPVVIHGDAAFCGQGIVYETIQFSKIDGYATGGTVHIVINNHVGFTATEQEGRSMQYVTDLALAFGCPVFHVNADDPEGCIAMSKLAMQIRQRFGCDVFIELLCYRKYGHNEADEPAFTLPQMYKEIRSRNSIRDRYLEELIKSEAITKEIWNGIEQKFRDELELELKEGERKAKESSLKREGVNAGVKTQIFDPIKTRVDFDVLKKIVDDCSCIPENFALHSKIKRLVNDRKTAVETGEKIDWGLAEYLAYGSLLLQGFPVRISGQDSQRGTFSHRHAVLVDQENGEKYFPLSHLKGAKAEFEVFNSCLSEYGVLGFEYGYSVERLNGLNIWEAQFGDFANGAQVMIDQYFSSGEQKWGQLSNLVMMLPHGFEAMGPEHSSARVERYLQIAANDNLRICVPTTPAQLFHIFRLHMLSEYKIPLVVFTTKLMLRYQPTLSKLSDFTDQDFQEALDDPIAPKTAKRLLICFGKVYYDLLEEREKRGLDQEVAIIRVELLYPLNKEKLASIIASYANAKECFWVQEEHKNMGAYHYINPHLGEILPSNLKLCYVGRAESASTAAGSSALHNIEKSKFMDEAFKNVNDQ